MRSNRADKWHSLNQVYSGCFFFTSISTKTKSLNFLKNLKLKNIEIKIFRAKKQALI